MRGRGNLLVSTPSCKHEHSIYRHFSDRFYEYSQTVLCGRVRAFERDFHFIYFFPSSTCGSAEVATCWSMSIEKLPIKRWSLFTCVVDQLILTLARGSRPWDGGIFWPPVHCGRERGTSWTVHYTPFQCTFAHSPKTGLCPLKKYYIYCLKLIEREKQSC